jgi:hypothetical protein
MRVLVLSAFSVVVAMVLSGASCGGKVVLDAPTSTGSGGAGGSIGSAGTAGAGGFFGSSGGAFGGAGSCFASGDPCMSDGECCSAVCDTSFQCE